MRQKPSEPPPTPDQLGLTPEQAERVEQLTAKFMHQVVHAVRTGKLTGEKQGVAFLIYSPEVFRQVDELVSVARIIARKIPADETIAALMSVVTEVIDRMSTEQAADFWREISEGAAAYMRTSMGGSMH